MIRVSVPLLLLSAHLVLAAPLTQLKPLYPKTPVVANGKLQAVLVSPPAHEQAAAALAAAIKQRCGAAPAILPPDRLVSESWQVDLPSAGQPTLIALGNINDNRLLAVLWGAGYVIADSLYPGAGGYAIRTVHDPFAKGVNVLALTGSDADGVKRAVEAFTQKYLPPGAGECVLPTPLVDAQFTIAPQRFFPLVTDSLSSKRQPQASGLDFFQQLFRGSGLMDEQNRVMAAKTGNLATVTGAIARLAQTWFWTGNPALPPLMKEILDQNRALLKIVPARVEMEAASAAHVRWWDLVEELPVWTDQDRLEVTNALLADALQGHEKRAAHKLVEEGYTQVVDENHGTNSAQNTLEAWRYFEKYYQVPESEYWMKVVRATFAGQAASFQVLEDACGYLCYCPIDSMEYAFATGDLTYLTRGIARSHAEFIAQCSINNLGLSSGFGDDGSAVEPGVYEAIAPAAWYYRDPRLAWVSREYLPQACGLRTFTNAIPFDLTVQPQEPKEWTGLSLFPIYKQTLRKGEAAKTPVFDPRESAGPEWFNKLLFREKWSPEAQYLLLDGSGKFGNPEGYPNSPAGHMHNDVNTIINFTDQDRMWLVDHTYPIRSIKDHSGLYISREGQVGYNVHEAKLRLAEQTPVFAATTSVFEDFSGADWERNILWHKGSRFVVIDRAIARQPGDYLVRCSFRGLGESTLSGPALRLKQGAKACAIISDGRARLDTEDFELPSAAEFVTWYKHAAPVVRIFQQDKHARLEAGQDLCFINLVQAEATEAALEPVKLRPLSPCAALVEDAGSQTLYGAGALPGGAGEAGAYVIASDAALIGNVRRLGSAERPALLLSQPGTLTWQSGQRMQLRLSKETQVTLAGGQPQQLAAGSQELPAAAEAQITDLLKQTLSAAPALAARYAAEAAQATAEPAFGVKTSTVKLGAPVSALVLADLEGNGRPDYVTAGAQGVRASRADGSALWSFATPQPCRALDAGDVDGDGKPEVVVGCDDGTVHLLSAQGQERWSFTCKPMKALTPAVDWTRVADLEGDGKPEIVVGAAWLHCLDGTGKAKWEKYLCITRGSITGNFLHGDIADVNGDGKQEIVTLFYYSYPKALIFGPDGTVVVPADYHNDKKPGINIDTPQALLVTGLFGQKDALNFLVGGPSYLYAYWAGGQFVEQCGGRRAGSYLHLSASMPATGLPLVHSVTDLGTIITYRPGPRRQDAAISLDIVWCRETAERVTALWSGDSDGDGRGEVWTATRSGGVMVYGAETGEPLARSQATGSPVTALRPAARGLLVAHDDGTVEHLIPGK